MRKLATCFGCALLIIATLPAWAGVVIGGTRFVFAEHQKALSLSLRNTSDQPWLVNIRVLNGGDWPGSLPASAGNVPLMVTPPLFSLKSRGENNVRIISTNSNLPKDRESLFTLSVASIPSGRPGPDSVQLAVRSRLKLFWRPDGLKGSPDNAYRQLRWQITPSGLMVSNPTPYYVTVFKLNVDGQAVDNAGVVAPFSDRHTPWCKGKTVCPLRWQSINDYGRVMPVVTLSVSGNANVSTTDKIDRR